MCVDEILGHSVEFRGGVDRDAALIVGNIPVVRGLQVRQFVEKFFQPPARLVVFIDARELEFQQLPLHIIFRCAIGAAQINRGQRFIYTLVERERRRCLADFRSHCHGGVAKLCIGMNLLHRTRKVTRGIVLADNFVKRHECVVDCSRAFYRKQLIDCALACGQMVVFDSFKCCDVRLVDPDRRLRHRDRRGLRGAQNRHHDGKNAGAKVATKIGGIAGMVHDFSRIVHS